MGVCNTIGVYGREDLNFHRVAPTATSTLRVYRSATAAFPTYFITKNGAKPITFVLFFIVSK
jgi:hypothetical protein